MVMKKINIIQSVVYVVMGATLFSSCSNHDIKISIKDSDDAFSFYADYDPKNTAKVYQYLNKALAPQKLFDGSHGHIEAVVTLADRTEVELQAERGHLEISMDKDKNSPASYHHMQMMYDDLKELVGD